MPSADHQNRDTYPILGCTCLMDVTERLLMPEEGHNLLRASGNISLVAKLTFLVSGLASQRGRGQTHGDIEPVREE